MGNHYRREYPLTIGDTPTSMEVASMVPGCSITYRVSPYLLEKRLGLMHRRLAFRRCTSYVSWCKDEFMSIIIPQVDKEIIVSVLDHVRRLRGRIEYGEMSEEILARTGHRYNAHFDFSDPLGRIQDYCVECGLPSLSVMVVTKKQVPGSGFITYYRGINPNEPRDDKQIIHAEQQACRDCEDWQKLLDYCGIQWKLPAAVDTVGDLARKSYIEGAVNRAERMVKEAKRDPKARTECLRMQGMKCKICGFDSEERYGIPGIIQVHHRFPLMEGVRETDPVRDLIPVCPTCHAILHSKPGANQVYDPDEVKEMLDRAKEY